jgi:hypothetical protein
MTDERKPQTDGKSSGKKVGRPVKPVPQDVADRLIEWISEGKTLREFCRHPSSPSFRTVYDWTEKDKEFAARLAHAREIGHDAIADETMEIIDAEPERINNEGGSKIDNAYVAWARNRVEQRLKLLAVWNPKKYGNRTTIAGDPDNPLIEPLDDTQRAAKVQAIMAAAAARKAQDGGV